MKLEGICRPKSRSKKSYLILSLNTFAPVGWILLPTPSNCTPFDAEFHVDSKNEIKKCLYQNLWPSLLRVCTTSILVVGREWVFGTSLSIKNTRCYSLSRNRKMQFRKLPWLDLGCPIPIWWSKISMALFYLE